MAPNRSDKKTTIWWIRRDLRLEDNQALSAAVEEGGGVVPLFIIDPQLVGSSRMGSHRMGFLWDGLRELRGSIQEKGADLVVKRGDPREVLPNFIKNTGAVRVYAEEDFTPYARSRDGQLQDKVPLTLTPGLTIAHPRDIRKSDGDPYQVYSYYMRKWKDRFLGGGYGDPLPAPSRIPYDADWDGEPIPEQPCLPGGIPFSAGEMEAGKRLRGFTSGKNHPIYSYDILRDRPDLNGTSMLSPYLHLGMISIRWLVSATEKALERTPDKSNAQSVETWLEELIWRDFYIATLYHFPHVLEGNFRNTYDPLVWNSDEEAFACWKEGKTGYPFVDAGMRQLLDTGWMHNRVRMVVASFLIKDLLIDWRWGETWFMKRLVDADLAANNGGWQWVAGTGTDAAPYFRIFNPISQSEKHDPQGDYIRRFVPELQEVPEAYIHQPWTMPLDLQKEKGCIIGEDYPQPLVDHSQARKRTLKAYREAREKSEGDA
jgi:deoxyribodipyrimidine photo-lyase